MARIRTIKPEFWTSEQVAEISPTARLLFIGLWNFADDAGRHPASIGRLKMQVFPADDCDTDQVAGWIQELLDVGLLRSYQVGAKQYWEITGWHHQRIDKPTYRYPGPDGLVPCSPNTRRILHEHSANTPRPFAEGLEGNGEDGSGKDGSRKDDDDDGARCTSSLEESDQIERIANRIAKLVPIDQPENCSLVAKTAILVDCGNLTHDDLEQALESVRLKRPGNPAAWLHECLTNKAKRHGRNFNAMLASVDVPDDLQRQIANRQRGPPSAPIVTLKKAE